jgi:RecA-family ATPase
MTEIPGSKMRFDASEAMAAVVAIYGPDNSAKPISPDKAARTPEIVSAAEYLAQDPPEVACILTDTFERGDKIAIIGQSKRRKSFLLMQICLCLSTGQNFLSWTVPNKVRVLLVQYEIKKSHAHRRIHRMASALRIGTAELDGQFWIISARGQTVTMDFVEREAKARKVDVIAFDPLFKMTEGDENKAADLKPVLAAFDRLAEATGAAVVYVHHDSKGTPGDRDIRDRGAGSNVLGRDYDACFTLTEHREDPNAVVVHTLLRNFAPQEPVALAWKDGAFRISDLEPVAKTSADRPSAFRDKIIAMATEHPSMSYRAIASKLRCSLGTVYSHYPEGV